VESKKTNSNSTERVGDSDWIDLRRLWDVRYCPGLTSIARSSRSGRGGSLARPGWLAAAAAHRRRAADARTTRSLPGYCRRARATHRHGLTSRLVGLAVRDALQAARAQGTGRSPAAATNSKSSATTARGTLQIPGRQQLAASLGATTGPTLGTVIETRSTRRKAPIQGIWRRPPEISAVDFPEAAPIARVLRAFCTGVESLRLSTFGSRAHLARLSLCPKITFPRKKETGSREAEAAAEPCGLCGGRPRLSQAR
jgi:hypothetical protein